MTRKEHLLTILSEECAEVIQRVSKALRFGLDEKEPGQKFTNSERITEELHDIIAVIEMLRDEGCLRRERTGKVLLAFKLKQEKVERYLKYSEKRGTLNEQI